MLLAWAGAFAAMAGVVAMRRAAAVRLGVERPMRVLLVRPCAGAAAGIDQAMASAPDVAAGVALTWVGCVAEPSDPAWPLVQGCAADLRRRKVAAHAILTAARGPNRKAEQVASAVARFGAGHDAVIVADADVDLASVDLTALLRPLGAVDGHGRTIALTWSIPVESIALTWGDRISRAILHSSWQAFAVLARLDRHVVVGKTVAIDARAIARIGPLMTLRDHLGEDFELGRRVEAAGLGVHCTGKTVRSLACRRSLPDVFGRYVRWLTVVRAQRPARLFAYPWLIAAAPLLLLGSATVAFHSPVAALGAAAMTVAARTVVSAMASAYSGVRPSLAAVAQGWLADLVLLGAFAAALLGREVRWANRPLVVGADGRLQASAEHPQDQVGERREQSGRERRA